MPSTGPLLRRTAIRTEFRTTTNTWPALTSAASVWKVRLESSPQGVFLHWNTQPGSIYQVQSSTDLKHWTNTGDPRWAAGSGDSMYVGGSNAKYYRGLLLR